MPDLGWQRYIDNQEEIAFLSALTVERTQDEFGNYRYYVCDGLTGDWIGDPFYTADGAFEEIERMRRGE